MCGRNNKEINRSFGRHNCELREREKQCKALNQLCCEKDNNIFSDLVPVSAKK